MNIEEIMGNADMAETWPDSGKLNWGEVSMATLCEWVKLNKNTDVFDVESVKVMFEDWWRHQNRIKGAQ